jgi:hypothetical protein
MLAGCEAATPGTPVAPSSRTVAPSVTAGPVPGATTPATSVPPSADRPTVAPSTDPPSSPALGVDPTLLDVLPNPVGGVGLTFSPEASGDVADAPGLVGSAEAVAYAIGVDGGATDLVVVSLVRLRPGAFSDAFFRDWRDGHDEAVCEPAGGVSGHGEATLGGRNVWIGSCVNGGNTYHAWLPDRRIVVSAYAVGDERLGEQLMAGIR